MKKRIIFLLLAAALLLCFCACEKDRYLVETFDNYDLSAIIKRYGGDLDSNFSVFPTKAVAGRAEVIDYRASFLTVGFDTDGELFLDCVYSNEADYLAEIERLSALSMTISNRGEHYTNKVLYDDISYPYPAYITIDGFGNTYEYALLVADKQEIIYLYLAYPGEEQFSRYAGYIKKDRAAYKGDSFNCFSMYNHSFDGGRSYAEFDD